MSSRIIENTLTRLTGVPRTTSSSTPSASLTFLELKDSLPSAPSTGAGHLFKQPGSEGLWWETSASGSLEITGLANNNFFTVNPARPQQNNNFHTLAAAVTAASSAPTGSRLVVITPGTYNESVIISAPGVKLAGLTPQGSVGSQQGTRILGSITLDAPDIELNNLLVQSNPGSGLASLVITDGAAPAPNSNLYIWNCSISRDPTDIDVVTPTIQGSAVVSNRVNLKIYHSVLGGLGNIATNGGVLVNSGVALALDAEDSLFQLGELTSAMTNASYLFQRCTFQNTFTCNKTILNLTYAIFLNCIINNNSRNNTVPIFTCNDSFGSGTTILVLVNCIIGQPSGSGSGNWLVNGNPGATTVNVIYQGTNHRTTTAVTAPSSSAPPAGVTFTLLPSL